VSFELDGAWLGSFYVISDVIHKESYSNAPCIRACSSACDMASEARWIAAEAVFSRSSKAVAATRGLQSTRQASLVQVCIHIGLVFVFCCPGARAEPTQARPLVRHLPSCAASCIQTVFSVPICWPSKWRHVTRRATRRLVEPLVYSVTLHHMGSAFSEEWDYRTEETSFSLQFIQKARLFTQKSKFWSLLCNDAEYRDYIASVIGLLMNMEQSVG
jgi:hypothetical protein